MRSWPLLAAGLLLLGCGDSFSSGDGAGGSAGSGAGGGGGSGGSPPADVGCSDGTRELFAGAQEPNVAGCAGGFQVPGVIDVAPACDRQAGNSGPYPNGEGCRAADLCAAGWHICQSAGDFLDSLTMTTVCPPASNGSCLDPASPGCQLWITRQTSPLGVNECAPQLTHNNLVGCGNVGVQAPPSCAPLNRVVPITHCNPLTAWECVGDVEEEAANVIKTSPNQGGVLCCRDPS